MSAASIIFGLIGWFICPRQRKADANALAKIISNNWHVIDTGPGTSAPLPKTKEIRRVLLIAERLRK